MTIQFGVRTWSPFPGFAELIWVAAILVMVPSIPEAVRRAKLRGWWLVRTAVMTYAVIFIAQYALWPILKGIAVGPVLDGNTDSVVTQFGGSVLVLFAVTVLIGPVVEETLYRFAIFGGLSRFSVPLAYLVSCFLFGLQHVFAPLLAGDALAWWNLPDYAIFGAGLCWAYRHEKTLVAPWLIHVINNALVVVYVFVS